MSTALPPHPSHTDWQILYRAAILEKNNSVIPRRLSEAETAVMARGRELFSSEGPTPEEREALDDALYVLRAFRNALEHAEAA